MNLVSGIHHVAVVTADIDRFIGFYTDVFKMPVIFQETTPAFRHALLLAGLQSVLHAAEMPNNIHSSGLPDMFGRGHIDHLALNAPTESAFQIIRRKLIDRRGVSDGAIADLGPVLTAIFMYLNHTCRRGARPCAPTAWIYLPENSCNLYFPILMVCISKFA
ncbi:VOC family protein [Nostoc sp. LPT]|uniref:VOC family protein n=1 Tax=Nostoc sp. LPT TaxID=2815387 RepID=UPI001D7C2E15|nr:VOC family protein [Nostoc sp. LPT]MBN4005071.1 VOC family protein [Nostoc sp. LPT]